MKVLINYAHITHYMSQEANAASAYKHGFNDVIKCSIDDLDFKWRVDHQHILQQRKGAGYWLWKPYLILKWLKILSTGDYLFYCDSGAEFIHSIDPLIDFKQDIFLFHTDPVPDNIEAQQTKRDAFILMDCEDEKYISTTPAHGGFQLYRVCQKSIDFVNEYLTYCEDERILTDQPNVMGKDNYPEFISHRHDQSVLSLLSKKYNILLHRDPTQYGNPYIAWYDRFYPQIIHHTRNPK